MGQGRSLDSGDTGGLRRALAGRRVVVCVGPGGVGKTTVAAALGVAAAVRGQRVLVLTIDPSRRLATSLGIAESALGPQVIPAERFDAAGLTLAGHLEAELLDTRHALDAMVARHMPDEVARARIMANPLYRHLGDALAGAQITMALEKLFEVLHTRDDDLVLLDTPPSATALDFLEAPQRLVAVLDNPLLQALPSLRAGATQRLGAGAGFLLRRLARLTGREIFDAMAELFADLGVLLAGMGDRARRVAADLRGLDAAFLVVTGPSALAVDEALFFRRRLDEAGFPFAAFVVNGVQPSFGVATTVDVEAAASRLARRPGFEALSASEREVFVAALRTAAEQAVTTAAAEHASLEPLAPGLVARVPRLSQDVHDLRGLAVVGRYLLEPTAPN